MQVFLEPFGVEVEGMLVCFLSLAALPPWVSAAPHAVQAEDQALPPPHTMSMLPMAWIQSVVVIQQRYRVKLATRQWRVRGGGAGAREGKW